MKCPKCGYNQKVKYGLVCGGCKYSFVFNPKTDQMSDMRFAAMCNKVSKENTKFFTINQLYGIFRKKTVMTSLGYLVLFISIALLIGGAISCFNEMIILGCIIIAFGIAGIVYTMKNPNFFKNPPFEDFNKHFKKWHKRYPIEKIIQEPKMQHPPPKWKESDIYDYGVEFIIIVERDILVDLFIKNNYHVDNKCLVISASKYPHYIFQVAQKNLQGKKDLPVYLYHDSGSVGESMQELLLNDPKWNLQDHKIVDMGLFGKDLEKFTYLKKLGYNQEDKIPADILPYRTMALGFGLFAAGAITIFADDLIRNEMLNNPRDYDFG